MKKLKKCYYAHPITDYGSDREAEDVFTLESLGFAVVNPNTPELDAAYKLHGMSVFLDLVKTCGCLAFRGFADGRIPAGVYAEIARAEAEELPVFELTGPNWHERRMSVTETRVRLKELGRKE